MRAHCGTLSATEITKSHGGDADPRPRLARRPPARRDRRRRARTASASRRCSACSPGSRSRTRGRVTRRPGGPDRPLPRAAARAHRDSPGGEAARAALREIFDSDDDVLLLDEPTNDLDFGGLAPARALRRVGRRRRSSSSRTTAPSSSRAVERGSSSSRPGRGACASTPARGPTTSARARPRGGRTRRRTSDYVARARAASRRCGASGRGRLDVPASRKLARETGGADRRATHALASKVRAAERRLERLERRREALAALAPAALDLDTRPRRRRGRATRRAPSSSAARFTVGPVSLELRHGDRLAIVGPNGSGKTTLLRALLGELPLARGTLHVGPSTSVRRARAGPRARSTGTSRCSTRVPRAHRRSARARRGRCSRSSRSDADEVDAAGALALTGRAHARDARAALRPRA